MNGNFADLLRPKPGHEHDAALILPGKGTISHAELDAMAGRFAAALVSLGLKPGDRLAAQTEKSPEGLVLYLACLRAGVTYTPVNTAYKRNETAAILTDADPAVVVVAPERLDEVAEILPGARHFTLDAAGRGSLTDLADNVSGTLAPVTLDGEATAIIMYTSGTTGRPKGAMLSHGALAVNGRALAEAWDISSEDRIVHCLPMFHAHGITVSTSCALIGGAALIWLPRFDRVEVLRAISEATIFMGVPTMYGRLLESSADELQVCRTPRLFLSGSAPLPADLFVRFEEIVGQRIAERYGMTETGINASNPLHGPRLMASVGLPLSGTEIRVVDDEGVPCAVNAEGSVQVRGPSLFSGYWKMPEATAEAMTADGWFVTGDIGRLDENGYLFLVGRRKDIIITGGYNVYPIEVEAALEQLPGIREAAVIRAPHPDFGEGVVAVVVADQGATVSEPEVVAALKERLASYKVPKRVVTVESLPRNTMGKIVKNDLLDDYVDIFTSRSVAASAS